MWTKQQLIDEAFGEIRLQGYQFDIAPEEQQMALRRLDTMMATWSAKGVRLGYLFGTSPDDSSLDSDSGVPLYAVEAVYLNLAIRLAAGLGKAVASDTRKAAAAAYDTLLWAAAQPIEQQMPSTMPRGAGSRVFRAANQPFMPSPDLGPLQIAEDGGLQFGS